MKRILVLAAVVCLAVAATSDEAVAPQVAASHKPQATSYATEAITIPQMMSYQGRLTDTLGQPVPNGNYQLTFRLYTVPTGGTAFWTEGQTIQVRSGLFSALLGAVTPISSLPDSGALYLSLQVAIDPELTPRLRIVSAAYAYKADTANYALAGGSPDNAWVRVGSDSVLYTIRGLGIARGGAGNALYGESTHTHVNLGVACTTGVSGLTRHYCTVGGGTKNTAIGNFATVAGGQRNSADTSWATVGGGADNNATGLVATVAGGSGNSAAGSWSTVGGGSDNAATGYIATVSGGRENTADAIYATVGGGFSNSATGVSATVAGGEDNSADTNHATVGGGQGNAATGVAATVGGGRDNYATGYDATVAGGSDNSADMTYATVGGGRRNHATAVGATVAGGQDNIADTSYATVSGGWSNYSTGTYATVGGGSYNQAAGFGSTVAGGYADSATGGYATVAGGRYNSADTSYAAVGGGQYNSANGLGATVGGGVVDSATGRCATIAGGEGNRAGTSYATVGGGLGNRATGYAATIPGGYYCAAPGGYSFAAGRYARANHGGSLVWSDSCSEADSVYTGGVNQWRVRARGGAWFYSNLAKTSGAYLAPGSNSWESACDSMTKEDFRPVDRKVLLDKVAALRVRDFKMKDQNDGTRHIGPVAQDFHNSFGYGGNQTSINLADADGVLLAAVQALYEQNQNQQAEIEQLKAELKRR